MARVPYLDPEDAGEDVARALRRLPPLHVFGLLAHAETAFIPALRLGSVILRELALDSGLRELAILQVGRLAARYEWDQHVPIAREAGISAEQIDALDRGELEADCWTAAQRAVLVFAAAIVSDGDVDDATYREVREHLGNREVVELALTAGLYLMLARIMTALRIDPDPPVGGHLVQLLSDLD
jgi:alkylhydroperoxidase family enzyme